jgi:hypothetical protein
MAAPSKSPIVRRALLGAGALVLPIGIIAIYLLVSRQDLKFSVAGDYVALFLGVAVGTVCLWHALSGANWRPIAMVVYTLLCLGTLVVFSFSFLCAVFGECL